MIYEQAHNLSRYCPFCIPNYFIW